MSEGGENKPILAFKPSSFSFHYFTMDIIDRKIMFQVIKMVESLMICVNYADNLVLNDLSLSMMDRNDKVPISTQLLGNFVEQSSKNMATRLAKKLNKSVYVSCNIDDKHALQTLEKRLYDEIGKCPEKF